MIFGKISRFVLPKRLEPLVHQFVFAFVPGLVLSLPLSFHSYLASTMTNSQIFFFGGSTEQKAHGGRVTGLTCRSKNRAWALQFFGNFSGGQTHIIYNIAVFLFLPTFPVKSTCADLRKGW